MRRERRGDKPKRSPLSISLKKKKTGGKKKGERGVLNQLLLAGRRGRRRGRGERRWEIAYILFNHEQHLEEE